MFCAECGSEINDKAAICPKCGVPVAGKAIVTPTHADVPNHLVGAILTTLFCCQITGIVAIVYASQVNTKLAQGDVAGAQEASRTASTWIIVSVITGFVILFLNVIIGVSSEM